MAETTLRRIWINNILSNDTAFLDVQGPRVKFGRAPKPANDFVLDSPYVDPESVVFRRRDAGWEMDVSQDSVNLIELDDRELPFGERVAVAHGQMVRIYPFTLRLDFGEEQATPVDFRHQLNVELSELIGAIHIDLLSLKSVDLERAGKAKGDEALLDLEQKIDELAGLKGLTDPSKGALLGFIAGQCVRGELVGGLITQSAHGAAPELGNAGAAWNRLISLAPEREQELRRSIDYFKQKLGLDRIADLSQQINAVEQRFWTLWDVKAPEIAEAFKAYAARRYLKKQIKDIVFGYGPLEDLLQSPIVTEIMVVDREKIYVERNGVLENSGRRFISDKVTESIIERIVSKVGRRIDKSKPLVDARLTDGSRVNAVIAPLAVSGPCLTIRKFPSKPLRVDDLVAKGALTRTVAEFLRAAVIHRCNVIVSGGTGTGKTTLLNCLSDFIPDKERIVTVEDTAELRLQKEHVVRLETKDANIEGAGAYTIRDLVKNALRMRPDRVVVGECRGGEALDMLQAMNTGHDGSLTTLHANSSEDALLRLEILVQMADAKMPAISIQRQIASAVDLIVQLNRFRDGTRRVTQVTEVLGIDEQHQCLATKDLFALTDAYGGHPLLQPTGALPTFMDELLQQGLIKLESFYL